MAGEFCIAVRKVSGEENIQFSSNRNGVTDSCKKIQMWKINFTKMWIVTDCQKQECGMFVEDSVHVLASDHSEYKEMGFKCVLQFCHKEL